MFGEGEKMKTIERDRGEMKKNRAEALHRNFINLDKSRSIERCRALKRVRKLSKSCPGSIERRPHQRISMDQGSCQVAIKHPESISMDRSSYREAVENAIKSS